MRGDRRVLQRWLLSASAAALFSLAAAGGAQAEERAAPRDFLVDFQQSLTTLPDAKALTLRGSIYVPAYTSFRGRSGQSELSTLLRIDNTSSGKPLVLERIDYFDTTGKLIQRYLTNPVALKPQGAIQIFVPASDNRGGPAPSFIVSWAATPPMSEPLMETVTFGRIEGEGYSFVSQGRPIKNVGKRPWLGFGLSR